MWNSQAPLKLLLSMPSTLDRDNLILLQKTIDVDKIVNSQMYGRDLCGEYAPFCEFCNKNLPYPCAHAYVRMQQLEGMNIEIDESFLYSEPITEEQIYYDQIYEAVEEVGGKNVNVKVEISAPFMSVPSHQPETAIEDQVEEPEIKAESNALEEEIEVTIPDVIPQTDKPKKKGIRIAYLSRTK